MHVYFMNSKYTRIPKQTKNSTMDNSTCFIMDLLSLQSVSVCFYLGVLDYCEKQIFCLTFAQKDIAKSAIPSFDSLYAIIKLKKNNYVFTQRKKSDRTSVHKTHLLENGRCIFFIIKLTVFTIRSSIPSLFIFFSRRQSQQNLTN